MTTPTSSSEAVAKLRALSEIGAGGCLIFVGGLDSDGYSQMRADGKPQRGHLLVWREANGAIPEGFQVDHKCRVKSCINLRHLRLVTHGQNQQNRGPHKDGKSGYRGVSWVQRDQRWQARAFHNGIRYHGGSFRTAEEANEAAIALRNRLFTHNIEEAA